MSTKMSALDDAFPWLIQTTSWEASPLIKTYPLKKINSKAMDFFYQAWISSLYGMTVDSWKYEYALYQSVQSKNLDVQGNPRLCKKAQLLKAVEY